MVHKAGDAFHINVTCLFLSFSFFHLEGIWEEHRAYLVRVGSGQVFFFPASSPACHLGAIVMSQGLH